VIEEETEETGEENADTAETIPANETAEEGERRRRRRRRRGKRRPELDPQAPPAGDTPENTVPTEPASGADQPSEFDLVLAAELGDPAQENAPPDGEPTRRRRARGGRRRRPASEDSAPAGENAEPAEPVYADIADIFEAAERAEELAAQRLNQPEPAPEPEQIHHPEDASLRNGPGGAETAEADINTPPAPAVTPILVGADAQAGEKKRGWWRK
jgi:ribonuclease E